MHLISNLIGLVTSVATLTNICSANHLNCNYCYELEKFSLIDGCKRSIQTLIYAENVNTIVECIDLAKSHRGLALNYRKTKQPTNPIRVPGNSTFLQRQHYLQQPQLYFNCHILECPENSTLSSLTTDLNFDYYSLYEPYSGIEHSTHIVPLQYICVPELGLFNLNIEPLNYWNASASCSQSNVTCSLLSHVGSEKRTNMLARLLRQYNDASMQTDTQRLKLFLAYIDLHYNRTISPYAMEFFNSIGESLQNVPYRAWKPGHPKSSSNSSCVALTSSGTWITVDCSRKLPYICEIFTRKDD